MGYNSSRHRERSAVPARRPPAGRVPSIAAIVIAGMIGVMCAGDRDTFRGDSMPPLAPHDAKPPATTSPPKAVPRAPSLAPAAPKRHGTISLDISGQLVADFVPLRKRHYAEAELPALFERMRRRGDEYCLSVWGDFEFDRARRFIAEKRVEWYTARLDKQRGGYRTVTAGCWNFFTMNDQHVDADFEVVRRLYPKPGYFDCFAVGYMQPYLMHSVLGCRYLTMLDIDWRIIDGHHQLLQHFRAGRLGSPEGVLAATRDLNLGWIAWAGQRGVRRRHKVDYRLFCQRANQQKLCLRHLMGFQRRFSELRRLDLALYSIHDALLSPDRPGGTKVVFLSNVVDSGYTTWGQYRRMMDRFRRSLAPGQRLALIHHEGGVPGFAIYELRRELGTPARYTLETRCRSLYPRPWRRKDKERRTFFDRRSPTKDPPSCWELVGRSRPKAIAFGSERKARRAKRRSTKRRFAKRRSRKRTKRR